MTASASRPWNESTVAHSISALLASHLAFARSETPPEDAHALDVARLVDSAVTFFSARTASCWPWARSENSPLITESSNGCTPALSRADRASAQRFSIICLVWLASVSYRQVSLETGSHPMFAPARALYAKAGFRETGPFWSAPR